MSRQRAIFAAQGHAAHGALGYVVIDLQTAIIEEARQRDPAFAAIGDRLGHLGLGRKTARRIVERLTKIVDQWLGSVLVALSSDIGLQATSLCLDLIELTDTFQQIRGERRRLGGVDVEYLAPEMRPESNLGDAVGIVQLVVAGIAIRLEIGGEAGQLR